MPMPSAMSTTPTTVKNDKAKTLIEGWRCTKSPNWFGCDEHNHNGENHRSDHDA
jgi:hypothetical protein